MYDPNDNFKDILTYNEILFDQVKYNRIFDLINKHEIVDAKIDYNSYGEFLFITLFINDKILVLYGLGFHVSRDAYISDNWFFYNDCNFNPDDIKETDFENLIKKSKVKKMITERKTRIEILNADYVQSEQGMQFENLADIFDDDAVSVMI